jgi:hemerythrin-like domain-containing protein
MADVVVLLEMEHRALAKLLDVVEQQASNLARHEPVNFRLLASAFEYLSSYPDQCHHPKEDLVYRKVLSRCPEMARPLTDVAKEHEALALATRDTLRAVRESEGSPSSRDDELAARLRQFLDLYRHHMLMEDRHFFPLAARRLSQEDLAEIDFTLFDRPDPLVDPASEARFAALRAEIMQAGADERMSSDQRAEATLLAVIRGIASFNEAMRRSGQVVYLAPGASEGYDLTSKGNVLVHIPACDEARAAWCAYFYWKATARPNATS